MDVGQPSDLRFSRFGTSKRAFSITKLAAQRAREVMQAHRLAEHRLKLGGRKCFGEEAIVSWTELAPESLSKRIDSCRPVVRTKSIGFILERMLIEKQLRELSGWPIGDGKARQLFGEFVEEITPRIEREHDERFLRRAWIRAAEGRRAREARTGHGRRLRARVKPAKRAPIPESVGTLSPERSGRTPISAI